MRIQHFLQEMVIVPVLAMAGCTSLVGLQKTKEVVNIKKPMIYWFMKQVVDLQFCKVALQFVYIYK